MLTKLSTMLQNMYLRFCKIPTLIKKYMKVFWTWLLEQVAYLWKKVTQLTLSTLQQFPSLISAWIQGLKTILIRYIGKD